MVGGLPLPLAHGIERGLSQYRVSADDFHPFHIAICSHHCFQPYRPARSRPLRQRRVRNSFLVDNLAWWTLLMLGNRAGRPSEHTGQDQCGRTNPEPHESMLLVSHLETEGYESHPTIGQGEFRQQNPLNPFDGNAFSASAQPSRWCRSALRFCPVTLRIEAQVARL